jgi:hypothetical protein
VAGSSSAKGNPASHRMSNTNLKARRAASWKTGQKRKEERKAEAINAERRNRQTKLSGGLTPWELAKQKRRLKRHASV